jgi:hypothetical protein
MRKHLFLNATSKQIFEKECITILSVLLHPVFCRVRHGSITISEELAAVLLIVSVNAVPV